MNERLLKPIDVARRLGVSASTVRLWEMQGKILALKTVSGDRLFVESEVKKIKKSIRSSGLRGKSKSGLGSRS